jgi:probable HAF family extracellular repeat protein
MKANLQRLVRTNGAGTSLIALLVVNCLTFPGYCGEIQYAVTDLGTLGGSLIYASGLNNSGQVVGNCSTTNGARRAFLYSNGHLADLGTLGGTNSYAFGINNSGDIVGGAETSAGIEDAFLNSKTVMSDLGTLGGTASEARAINNQGQIAGSFWTTGNTALHAYLYSAGTTNDLGTLGGTRSMAFAMNDNGQVAGQSSITGVSPSHAFLYDAGTMTDLGTLGGAQSFAYGINNSGQVVGGAFTSTSVEHAFLYSGGTMTDLDSFGSFQSRAYAINRFGEVAGFISGPNTGGDHAFVYIAGTLTDLNTVIDTNLGWTLEVAAAMNDRGQIAGIGTHPAGTLRAFLLTPVPNVQISLTASNAIQLQFVGHAGEGYVIEYRSSLDSGSWQIFTLLDPVPVTETITVTDPLAPDRPTRFYRVRTR